MKLELVMLAAGNSRRFGSNKLLYTVDGQPMYRHILSELEKIQKQLESQGTQCSITVVTQYDEIAEDVRKRGISALYNLHPEEGISSSLRIGLRKKSGCRCLSVYCLRSALASRRDGSGID